MGYIYLKGPGTPIIVKNPRPSKITAFRREEEVAWRLHSHAFQG